MAAAFLTGCGTTAQSPPPPPPPPPPPSIAIVSGDGQTTVAGDTLALRPVVRVFDRDGPRPGVTVTFNASAVNGWGRVDDVTTDALGHASVRWLVNGQAGIQHLSASLQSHDSVFFTARVTPGPPGQIRFYGSLGSFAEVGSTITGVPTVVVTDSFSNLLAGRTVRFHLLSGGGSIADSVQVTDSSGTAALGRWTLGPTAAVNTLSATVDSGPSIHISWLGAPDSIAVVAGDSQHVNVGTFVPLHPTIRVFGPGGRRLGAGFRMTFGASGSWLAADSAITDSTGLATLPPWLLGDAPGPDQVQANSFGKNAFVTAIGVLPTIAGAIPVSGDGTQVFAGNLIPARPSFRVVDSVGKPIGGQMLAVEASDGGTATWVGPSDSNGVAVVGSWRAGATTGTQVLRVVQGGRELGRFTTNVSPPPAASNFTIEVRFRDSLLTMPQRQAFIDAAGQWMTAIVGDVPDVALNLPADPNHCFPALHETVDDIVVYVSVTDIDGPGGVFAATRPCVLRSNGSLPAVSQIQVDAADLSRFDPQQYRRAALHELAHALGFGALWSANNLQIGTSYTGLNGVIGITAAAHSLFAYPTVVRLEGDGGLGIALVHWSHDIGSELMTAFLDPTGAWSVVTLASMRDLGYVVNDAVAEPFPANVTFARTAGQPFGETVPRGPIYVVSPSGKTYSRVPPN